MEVKTLSDLPISLLDLARLGPGDDFRTAYQHSKEAAQKAEELGFHRFWLAEHHNIEGIASAATAVLIGYIAENTQKIRVGSGGIMLPNHSPMIVAEQFGTLAALYPDRIDLGLGRAPGSDQATMRAIRGPHRAHEIDFGELIDELMYYFSPPQPGQRVKAIPGAGQTLPIYILGSSLYSAQLVARLGRPYAFAGHFAPTHMEQAFAIYRQEFQPSEVLSKPYVMVGLPVIAASTDEEAEFLATTLKQAFLGMIRGERTVARPPVHNMDEIWTEQEKHFVESMLRMLVTGSPETLRAKLDQVIQRLGADELIITSDPFRHEDRLRSLELIMQAKNKGR